MSKAVTFALSSSRAVSGARRPAVTVAVAALLGAEALHAAAYISHRRQWVWAGVFFAVLCLAEWLMAWALLSRREDALILRLAVALSLLTAAVWAVSRTVGLPFGPERGLPEPVGWADGIATALELVTAAAACHLLRGRTIPARLIDRTRLLNSAAIAGVAAVTAVGLWAPEAPHPDPMAMHFCGSAPRSSCDVF
jgi:hypothetical protein